MPSQTILSMAVAIGLLLVSSLLTWSQPLRPPAQAMPNVGIAPAGTASSKGLEASLRRSITQAERAAAEAGVELRIASGRRSKSRQAELFREALAQYGSRTEARRWVLPPEESAHVAGQAVDVSPPAGARWLSVHGEDFGLCQRYANEPWHFERLAGALGSTCPPMEPHP